eukprot:scaffold8363_cov153-Skeletonema_marinoi.AAC.1
MQIDTLFFENFTLPFRAAIGLFLTLITLAGFYTFEKIREQQIKKTELAKKQGREPTLYWPHSVVMLFNMYSFNFLMLTFAFAGNMDPPYLLATTWLSFAPQLAIPLLVKTKFFSLITSKYAFGFRGCVIALGICGSLYNTLQVETQSPNRELRFLSLVCFAFAAWVSCGLGSHPGWASHPEYGEFAEEKKVCLLLMQVYFVAGFILQFAATSFVKVKVD